MTTGHRTVRSDEPLALELTAAVKQDGVERLNRLLAEDPSLAHCVVEDPKGGGRTPLHLFADWPGHNPNAATLVQTLAAASADLNAPAVHMWHRETPLHWAASNHDVVLIDALIDAGADIEHDGSSIDGGSPFVVSNRLRSMGGGAAVGRARRPNPSLARSRAGVTFGNYAPRGSLPLTAT